MTPSAPPRFRFSLLSLVLFVAVCGSIIAVKNRNVLWTVTVTPTKIETVFTALSANGDLLLEEYGTVKRVRTGKTLTNLRQDYNNGWTNGPLRWKHTFVRATELSLSLIHI